MEWDKLEQILGIALATVVLKGVEDYGKWRKKKKEDEDRPKRKTANVNTLLEIKSKLVEIRKEAGCNRVCLFEFSNGKTTHGNISLEFIFCTLEDVDNKSAGMSERFQNIPAATMYKTISEIEKSEKGWTMFDDRSNDETANQRRRYWGIMSSLNAPITDDIWEGMIGLHWMNNYADIEKINILEILRLIEDVRNLMANLVKKEDMNIWKRLRWALTFYALLMIVQGRDVIVSNYRKSLSKPTIEAMISRDLYKYHEKRYHDGK